jgi:hypothetical protein
MVGVLLLVVVLAGGCLSLPTIRLHERADVEIDAERKVCLGVVLTVRKRAVFDVESTVPQ